MFLIKINYRGRFCGLVEFAGSSKVIKSNGIKENDLIGDGKII